MKIMTIVTIKEAFSLSKKEYQTADEFIDDYLSSRDSVTLHEVDETNLPSHIKKDFAESRSLAKKNAELSSQFN